MKQTALDYFMQSLGITKTSKFEITDTDGSPKIIHVSEVFEQAKAMERSQKAEEYVKGFKDGKESQIKLDELTFKSE